MSVEFNFKHLHGLLQIEDDNSSIVEVHINGNKHEFQVTDYQVCENNVNLKSIILKDTINKLNFKVTIVRQDHTTVRAYYSLQNVGFHLIDMYVREVNENIHYIFVEFEKVLRDRIRELITRANKNLNLKNCHPDLYDAFNLIMNFNLASTSLVQQRLKLGHREAKQIMDELESFGVLGPAEGSKPREIKIKNKSVFETILTSIK